MSIVYDYVQDMIKTARALGYRQITSGKTTTMFRCPQCKKVKMVMFKPPEDGRKRVHACICGYRAHSGQKSSKN